MTHKTDVSAPQTDLTPLLHALERTSVLRVVGDDARSWLNGQVTNDVRATKPGDSVYALVINLKGRIVADAWIFDEGESFLVLVPSVARDAVVTQFEKYIIMEDVTITTLDEMRAVTLQAPKARTLLGALPQHASIYSASRLDADGIDILIPRDEFDSVWDQLSTRVRNAGGRICDAEEWRDAHIDRGLPLFGSDFGDKTYPQEVGLESRAVSFNKGCYLGQEVVCMLENRGQLTRRLVALDFRGAPPGTETSVTSADGNALGELTSVNMAKSRGLAMVRRKAATPGTELIAGGVTAIVTRVVDASRANACKTVSDEA